MAAVASPTPAALISSYHDQAYRKPSSRNVVRATRRPYPTRSSPHVMPPPNFASSTRTAAADSSDDEDLAPIKLSAEAQAILGEDNANPQSSGNRSRESIKLAQANEAAQKYSEQAQSRILPQSSISPDRDNGSPAPRVVRIASGGRPTGLTSLARDGSFMYKTFDRPAEPVAYEPPESKTPGTRLRRIRVSGSRSHTRSPPLTLSAGKGSGSSNGSARSAGLVTTISPEGHGIKGSPADEVVPTGPSTIVRPRRGDENGLHSTMRIRRIGAGSFLNGPIRRGMIRRQSDEEDFPIHQDSENGSVSPEMQVGRRAPDFELEDKPDDLLHYNSSPRDRNKPALHPGNGQNPVSSLSSAVNRSDTTQNQPINEASPLQAMVVMPKPTPASNGSLHLSKSSSAKLKPVFKIPSLPPLPSANDQENEPPPTFKRPRPTAIMTNNTHGSDGASDEKPMSRHVPSSISPHRQPLVPRSENTPHRPAPAPPPRMSILEAATSVAGSSRAKKPAQITVNNKTYRRLDCIGRGGSSRVYRIMADNFKIFALKRVNLEDADMAAIAGYKGEIDLLRKLENVDRVVRLFDYEVNETKGILNVMMELGESDFNKMLNEQLKTENAKLDVSFTRHYWKEMLECVQAVHEHGIVHSDLKPANFLLVKGQLKLIDFGIANAIQDNTVNVHRENQIGTPNYMSPESLVCHTPAIGAPGGKILKLGKPSDVWSLGCILYQMTYGQPPFAHITKQFERIMSIPNPKVEIHFPATGVGGAVVPFGLIKTLRRCLQREQSLRPTVQELLSDNDPFLNPVAISPDMLGRMISNVVSYCRRKEESLRTNGELVGTSPIPTDADMNAWPWAFYEKLKQAQEDGTAW